MVNQEKDNFGKDLSNLINIHSYNLHEGLEPLLDRIGDSRIVLLGEASHGTHEYYLWRSRITQELVRRKNFRLIGVEGDWPDCYKINRYIRNYKNAGRTAFDVLKTFHRWPTWMWANWEIAALMEWLKENNTGKTYEHQVGFYGLDVYSLWESLEAIMDYLQKNDPDALETAQEALQCFEPYQREGVEYARAIRFVPESCEDQVLELLQKIRTRVQYYPQDTEAPLDTEQNAMTAVNAEKYYRSMISGGPESWNIRDEHMVATIEKLLDFHGSESKIIVWEHNTHIGDARATDMRDDGMVNVGQLVRERWGEKEAVLVGFGSYEGTVIAGKSWGAPMQVMQLPSARFDSFEALLHRAPVEDKLIITSDIEDIPVVKDPVHHRAVGVVYHPDRDHFGNYVLSNIPRRYDSFIFLDKTQALHPIKSDTEGFMIPETYPWNV